MVCNKTHTYSIISTVHASCVTAILNLSWKHSTRFIAAAFFFNRSNVSLMLQMYKRRWIVRLGLVYVYNICTLNMYFYNVTYIYSLLVSLLHNRTFAWWCINYSAFILLWILFLKRSLSQAITSVADANYYTCNVVRYMTRMQKYSSNV